MAPSTFSPTLLQGQVAIVTGAGSAYGIGRSIVLGLVAAGIQAVYATDLNLGNIPSLQEAAKNINSDCIVDGLVHDVSSEEQTLKVIKDVTKRHGRLDLFFANAGYVDRKALENQEVQDYDRTSSVMARSVFLTLKYASKAMVVTSTEKLAPAGSIVVTGSSAGLLGSWSDLCYTAAKSAVQGLVKSGSVQLSTSNIRVNCVAPGPTQSSLTDTTKFIVQGEGKEYNLVADEGKLRDDYSKYISSKQFEAQDQYYYNRIASPDEMANVAIFLASSLASGVNGQTILADSGKMEGALGEKFTGPILEVTPLSLE